MGTVRYADNNGAQKKWGQFEELFEGRKPMTFVEH